MIAREPGYYWVRLRGEHDVRVAELSGLTGKWYICGTEEGYHDNEVVQVLDRVRRDAEMFVTAWVREVGSHLRSKAHLIDALVLTTRDIVQKADRLRPRTSAGRSRRPSRLTVTRLGSRSCTLSATTTASASPTC